MDLSMSIIDDDQELDRILESTNLDEYEPLNLPMEQPNDLLHELKGVRMAPTLDTESICTLGLAPHEGSSTVLHSGVDPCQGYSLSSYMRHKKDRKNSLQQL